MCPLTKVGAYDASAQAEIIKSDPWQGPFTQTPGDISPNPSQTAFYMLNKGTAAAVTLLAPVSGVDDYKSIGFISGAANSQQHVITATGLLQTGSAYVNLATFAAQLGCNLIVMAYQGKWYVVSSLGVTFS